VVRPQLAPMALPPLALAIGLAAHETLHALGVAVDLKWPNDVLARGKKLGGILIEMASELSRVSFAVIGVGINVNLAQADLPAEIRGPRLLGEKGIRPGLDEASVDTFADQHPAEPRRTFEQHIVHRDAGAALLFESKGRRETGYPAADNGDALHGAGGHGYAGACPNRVRAMSASVAVSKRESFSDSLRHKRMACCAANRLNPISIS